MSDGPGATRVYETAEVRVHWDASLCRHSGNCVRGLPSVFDVKRKPWIDVTAAPADAVVATVLTCPSGALRQEDLRA